MDWGTLLATVGGAVIAMSGTVIADTLRNRREKDASVEERRRSVYNDFIAAAGTCHARLRELAQYPDAAADPQDLDVATRAALGEAGMYEARERLFIEASTAVAGAGQAMFERLRELRRVVATGAAHDSPAFHAAYHPYIGAVWGYRAAVRAELDGRALAPADFGWAHWDGTDRCTLCAARDGTPG